MNWRSKALLPVLCVISQLSFAQEGKTVTRCSYIKSNMAAGKSVHAKTTVADPAEDNYDVKYVKLDLQANNQNTYITGAGTTVAQVGAMALSSYVFELSSALTIDSALVDGVVIPVSTTGDVRTLPLATAIPAGTSFTVFVRYHGTPVAGSAFFSPGLSNLTSPSWGNKVTSTLSESYKAKDWWPCKQSLTDKIDSVDMWITVPDTLKAGSNGILTAVTPMGGGYSRYEWKERKPMDYYLLSIAVAGYVDYSYYMHYTGSDDSTLVQNYVYNNPATLPHFKSVIDSTGLMIDYFSTLYGRYPFWQEKYGHCMAPISGGMEHQTMTTLGYFEGTLVAHELAHQWFGDNVTCGSWKDIVMNEGFAAYSEYLFTDHFGSHTAAINTDMKPRHYNVKSQPGGSVYVDDTTDENRIFSSRLTYDKGACVLHMLRFIVSDDTAFFRLYRQYQSIYGGGTGTIADFKAIAISQLGAVVNGVSLDTFFNQWAYREGYPIYNVQWNQNTTTGDVYVQLDQATSMPSSVPLFTMPVEIRLRSATGDTVVRVVNDQASQQFHFNWPRFMSNIALDPNSWLVDSVQIITHNAILGTPNYAAAAIRISPNPTTGNWTADALAPNSTMTLTDVTGRTLWQANTGNNTTIVIPADKLAAGIYLLRVSAGDAGTVKTCKLVKE